MSYSREFLIDRHLFLGEGVNQMLLLTQEIGGDLTVDQVGIVLVLQLRNGHFLF
jgi:hypothetical protein